MASVFITRRKTKAGKTRHVVRYRLGGRTYPIVHGGSFGKLRDAQERERLIGGELAAGRNPALLLAAMRTPPEPVTVETLAELGERYLVSRVDLDEKTEQIHRSVLNRANIWGGTLDPLLFTFAECQELVGWLMRGDEEHKGLSAATVKKYMNVFAQVLDFAGLDPNPARDRRVKLPTVLQDEPEPPTGKQFLAILDNAGERWTLPLLVMKQCAMHVEERSRLPGAMSIPPNSGSGSAAATSRAAALYVLATRRSPTGSWIRSPRPARLRIVSPSGECSQASRTTRRAPR
jgi:hypothetical protein